MKYIFSFLFLLCCLRSYSQDLTPREGFVQVEGGKVWYKIVGEGKGTPLLLVHGGPGSTSCKGMATYARLSDERPVIFYDQLGTGNSERVWDTALWKPSRFANEIDSLRKSLNLHQVHILGHSWGGAVLLEYLVKKPAGVQSAIFAAPLISTLVWIRDAETLVSQMPRALQDTIKKYERIKDYEAASYIAATDSFYARYLYRKGEPLCVTGGPVNDSIYHYMWGPTEFKATGTLKNYDRMRDLEKLSLPVLFIAGQYDEARPETMKKFQGKVKGSALVIIPDSGHGLYRDQPILYTQALREFLDLKDQ
jgi:proline iminopeptidase